jgi:uncharacterized protein (DUF427 family)
MFASGRIAAQPISRGEKVAVKRVAPGPGQESVWDYPRPPRMEPTDRHLEVRFAGILIADTRSALRVLETSGPPVYYLPPCDILMQYLQDSAKQTFCEWKGDASHYTVQVGETRAENAAWCYRQPTVGYEAIRDHIAFYPARMEACLVDGELVRPQPGDYYGGWITSDIVGPFKGPPGTAGW